MQQFERGAGALPEVVAPGTDNEQTKRIALIPPPLKTPPSWLSTK